MSLLTSLPTELLTEIALELALQNAVGPPSRLTPFLLVSRRIHNALSIQHNTQLYFRIFISQFDSTAHRRRFGPTAHRAPVLAKQLVNTWSALRRLRSGQLNSETLLDDLWEAFCLLTENDGKNIAQLEWAGVHSLAERFVLEQMWEDRVHGWPRDTPINSLALWLLWGTMDHDTLIAYGAERRQELINRILPFVVVGFKYSNYYAPDVVYNLPLPVEIDPERVVSQVNAHGTYPVFRSYDDELEECNRFGMRTYIIAPPLPSAAKLLYFALRESVHIQVPNSLPVNRAAAIAAGQMRGHTQADLHEINAHRSTPFVPTGEWNFLGSLTDLERRHELEGSRSRTLKAPSALWDDDWERMTTCWDPWAQPHWKGPVYTFGALDGLWQGRLLIPDLTGYLNLVTTQDFPAEFGESAPFMSTWPAFMRLREHHCISPQKPVAVPKNPQDPVDDGVWNAWVPQRATVIHNRDSVVVLDDDRNRSVLETFVEGRPNSHDERTCSICIKDAEVEAEDDVSMGTMSAGNGDRAESYAEEHEQEEAVHTSFRHEDFEDDFAAAGLGRSSDDDGSTLGGDDGDSDAGGGFDNDIVSLGTVTRTCSGIQDVFFTGETDPNHGMAWGHFVIFGRIRPWDGLIALVRAPAEPGRPRWVFRGYLHYGQALVGAWRGMTNIPGQARAVPWEGPFTFSKRNE